MSAPAGRQVPVARKKKPRWRIWAHAAKVVLWRRRAKLTKALGALALVAAVCVAVSYWSAKASAPEAATPTRDPMEQVAASCGVSAASDGKSITMHTAGAKTSGGKGVKDVACVLVGLGAPQHIYSLIDATRALDGMQSESWGDYVARWTYHPDNGLTIVIAHKPK